MASWWLDRVLPGVVGGVLLGAVAYVRLHFERKWPYWGRQKERKNG